MGNQGLEDVHATSHNFGFTKANLTECAQLYDLGMLGELATRDEVVTLS